MGYRMNALIDGEQTQKAPQVQQRVSESQKTNLYLTKVHYSFKMVPVCSQLYLDPLRSLGRKTGWLCAFVWASREGQAPFLFLLWASAHLLILICLGFHLSIHTTLKCLLQKGAGLCSSAKFWSHCSILECGLISLGFNTENTQVYPTTCVWTAHLDCLTSYLLTTTMFFFYKFYLK